MFHFRPPSDPLHLVSHFSAFCHPFTLIFSLLSTCNALTLTFPFRPLVILMAHTNLDTTGLEKNASVSHSTRLEKK